MGIYLSDMNTNTVGLVAGAVTAALLVVLVLFQVALASGAPWGAASYGGQDPVLPARLRATSAVAAVVWVLVALVVLRRAGYSQVWAPLPDTWLPAAVWTVVGVLVLGCVLNAITPSTVERAVWLPVTLAALVGTTTVALTSA